MSGLAQAERIYDRRLPSDSARPNMDAEDLRQAKEAEMWADYLRKTVMLDGVPMNAAYDVASATLDHIAGQMTTRQCVEIGRAYLRGDKEAVFKLVGEMTEAAIKTQAEAIAERE